MITPKEARALCAAKQQEKREALQKEVTEELKVICEDIRYRATNGFYWTDRKTKPTALWIALKQRLKNMGFAVSEESGVCYVSWHDDAKFLERMAK